MGQAEMFCALAVEFYEPVLVDQAAVQRFEGAEEGACTDRVPFLDGALKCGFAVGDTCGPAVLKGALCAPGS